jgi:hypothetical protein
MGTLCGLSETLKSFDFPAASAAGNTEGEMNAAEIVRLKILAMEAQIKFLEFVWNDQIGVQEWYINNYSGEVPDKYKFK